MQNFDVDTAKHHSGWSWSVNENVITLEPHGIFWSEFAYLYILTFSVLWYEKRGRALPHNSTDLFYFFFLFVCWQSTLPGKCQNSAYLGVSAVRSSCNLRQR